MERSFSTHVKDMDSMELALSLIRGMLEEVILSRSEARIEVWIPRRLPQDVQHPVAEYWDTDVLRIGLDV